jgi:RNA polymerase primary sigma factor
VNLPDNLAERPVNRLLKMAVLAGVEAAVLIHVRRGDDLDARDGDGMTPLMLAASKNRAAICALLLKSGADAFLTNTSGHDALEIAKASGAAEAAAVLESIGLKVMVRALPEECEPALPAMSSNEPPCACLGDGGTTTEEAGRLTLPTPPSEPSQKLGQGTPCVPQMEPESDATCDGKSSGRSEMEPWADSSPDIFGWEPEADGPPPEVDETLAAAASAAHMEISTHKPIDTAEDWEDFEAFFPERAAPLPRAGDDEGRERIRRMLLRALREGSVPDAELVNICSSYDGARNEEGEALLRVVLGDLGAVTDERAETEAVAYEDDDYAGDAVEETEVSEALAFLDDLGSGRTEPLRIYVREMARRRLLTAEEEPALAKEIEEGAARALDALASWPDGVATVLAATERVRTGEVDVEDVSTGGAPEPSMEGLHENGSEAVGDVEPDEGGDAGAESGDNGEGGSADAAGLTDAAKDFLDRVDEISRLAGRAGKGGAGEKSLREALASANLSRPFLLSLANDGKTDGATAEGRFAAAMARQSAARERLAVSNLRLALSIARRHLGRGLPLDDLVQEANIGLLKAVDRFDWRRGFRFSTYATWWIRQQVTRAVADKGKTIRTPVHLHELMMRTAREADATERETGRRPSAAELARAMSVSPAKVAVMLARMEEPVPLHEPDSDGVSLEDVMADTGAPDPSLTTERAELAAALRKFLAELEPRAAEVMTTRFGLGEDESRTLEETGEIFGVTRERIRQIEAKSLRKLRHPSRSAILADFLDTAPKKDRQGDTDEDVAGPDDGEGPEESEPKRKKMKTAERDSRKKDLNMVGTKADMVRPAMSSEERAVTMARNRGFSVKDERESGGGVTVTIGSKSDGATRVVARALMNAGFTIWPGRVFRK